MVRVRFVSRPVGAMIAVLGLAVLAGCGSGDVTASGRAASTPTSTSAATPAATPAPTIITDPTPSTGPLPRCASIWVVGHVLPDRYAGCRSGAAADPEPLRCETGQELFTHAGRLYAVPGGPIFGSAGSLRADPHYRRMERACGA